MIHLVAAIPWSGYRLKVRFSDGGEGVYPVEPERRGGVFRRLLDPKVFRAVRVNPDFGCVEWPGGVDLCPTAMHDELRASGRALTFPGSAS